MLKPLCPMLTDLHFVDAYLGSEVEPIGVVSQKDDSATPTPWTWIVEKRHPMSVMKWSGTLAHPNYHTDLIGATICAFVHFAYLFRQRSVVFADIQGVFNHHGTNYHSPHPIRHACTDLTGC